MEESNRAYLLSSSPSSSEESDKFVPRWKTSKEGTHFQATFPIETAALYLPQSNLKGHSQDLLPVHHVSPTSSRLHERNAARRGTRRWTMWQIGTVAMSAVLGVLFVIQAFPPGWTSPGLRPRAPHTANTFHINIDIPAGSLDSELTFEITVEDEEVKSMVAGEGTDLQSSHLGVADAHHKSDIYALERMEALAQKAVDVDHTQTNDHQSADKSDPIEQHP
eukprot:gene24934-10585_t